MGRLCWIDWIGFGGASVIRSVLKSGRGRSVRVMHCEKDSTPAGFEGG